MQELTRTWRDAFARLATEQRSTPPAPNPCGAWSVTIDGSMSSASAIIAGLPGTWSLDRYDEEELIDASGEGIDVEWTSELWVAADERALFACVDHWQVGLIGTVMVFADEALFTATRVTLSENDDGISASLVKRGTA